MMIKYFEKHRRKV